MKKIFTIIASLLFFALTPFITEAQIEKGQNVFGLSFGRYNDKASTEINGFLGIYKQKTTMKELTYGRFVGKGLFVGIDGGYYFRKNSHNDEETSTQQKEIKLSLSPKIRWYHAVDNDLLFFFGSEYLVERQKLMTHYDTNFYQSSKWQRDLFFEAGINYFIFNNFAFEAKIYSSAKPNYSGPESLSMKFSLKFWPGSYQETRKDTSLSFKNWAIGIRSSNRFFGSHYSDPDSYSDRTSAILAVSCGRFVSSKRNKLIGISILRDLYISTASYGKEKVVRYTVEPYFEYFLRSSALSPYLGINLTIPLKNRENSLSFMNTKITGGLSYFIGKHFLVKASIFMINYKVLNPLVKSEFYYYKSRNISLDFLTKPEVGFFYRW